MRILKGHTRDVRAVAFAPDGRLVSGGGDRCDIETEAACGGEVAVVGEAVLVGDGGEKEVEEDGVASERVGVLAEEPAVDPRPTSRRETTPAIR